MNRGPALRSRAVACAVLALCGCGPGNKLPSIPDTHRATATACLPNNGGLPCTTDADCHQYSQTAKCEQGYCNLDTCTTDAECGALNVCACRGDVRGGGIARGFRVCLESNCRLDADCGPRGYCSPSVSPSCGPVFGLYGYFCHAPDDECVNDSECVKPDVRGYCAFHKDLARWACGYTVCTG